MLSEMLESFLLAPELARLLLVEKDKKTWWTCCIAHLVQEDIAKLEETLSHEAVAYCSDLSPILKLGALRFLHDIGNTPIQNMIGRAIKADKGVRLNLRR